MLECSAVRGTISRLRDYKGFRYRNKVLTYTSLVQQAERAASEGGEAHAEHCADVAVHRGSDDIFLEAQHSLVHEPGSSKQTHFGTCTREHW